MRKGFFIILCGFVLSVAVTAQERVTVRTIFLDRVYQHQYGFAITYGDVALYYNEVLLPMRWFGSQYRSLAKLYRVRDGAAPYIIIYYTDGNVSDIHLYIPENPLHPQRYTLKGDRDIKQRFDINIEDVQF